MKSMTRSCALNRSVPDPVEAGERADVLRAELSDLRVSQCFKGQYTLLDLRFVQYPVLHRRALRVRRISFPKDMSRRMDLCDYDLSLPPEHPYNMAVGSSVGSSEGILLRSWNTFEVWTTRSLP